MNLWFRNTNFLKANFPDFYQKVVSEEFSCPGLSILPDNNKENWVLQYKQVYCYLHSTLSVQREMEELFSGDMHSEQVLIILGLGMGYCIDYLREKKLKYKKILILEPYNNIFRELLKHRDIAALLSQPELSVLLFYEPRDIIARIMGESLSSRNVKILYHMSYRSVFDGLYQEITRLFANEKLSLQTSRDTLNRFLQEWTQNQMSAIGKEHLEAAILNERFADIPAIIVSAGPSLEKHFSLLAEVYDRALLIAAGTSVKILKQNNIPAHIAMAMDSQQSVADIVRDSHIPVLVGAYRLHRDVERAFPNQILRFPISTDLIAGYYHKYAECSLSIINDHASVASVAVHYAVQLGCNPIILVGQDLCFYDNRMYASSEKESEPASSRARYQEAVDINGNRVFTQPAFLAMRSDMEALNLRYRDKTRFFNCTEGGLGIPGMENQVFAHIIAQYINNQNVKVSQRIADLIDEAKAAKADKAIEAGEFYRHLLKELEHIKQLNNEKLDLLKDLRKAMERGLKSNRLQSKLQSIQDKNKELGAITLYSEVLLEGVLRFLTFYKAAALYSSDGDGEDPETWMLYESSVYEMTSKHWEIISEAVNRELALLPTMQGEV